MIGTKDIAELVTIYTVGGWFIFTELAAVPDWIAVALKVAVGVSAVTYNVVKTTKVLKSKK